MAKEPDQMDQENIPDDLRPSRGKSSVSGTAWIMIIIIVIVEGAGGYFLMQNCQGSSSSAIKPWETDGETGGGRGKLNSTVKISNVLTQLKSEPMAPNSKLHCELYLEVTNEDRFTEVEKVLINLEPWIKDMIGKETLEMTPTTLRAVKGRLALEARILKRINDRLGPWQNRPQVKTVLIPVYTIH